MAETLDTTNALVSKEDAKVHCKINSTTFDDTIVRIINSVSVMFNNYTRRGLLSRTNTEYYDGDGGNVLFLDNYPVTAMTTLHIDPDRVYGSTSLIASTDYVLYSDKGKIVIPYQIFPEAPQSVKVVYVAGYALATLPGDLKIAALDQIKFQFDRWNNNRESIASVAIEGQNVTVIEVKDLLPSVKAVLDKYVRPRRG